MHMLVFNNYFCKNRKSKLHFGDRVAVLNVFLYRTGWSMVQALDLRCSKFLRKLKKTPDDGTNEKERTML
jgi:hypothetical protein